MGSYEEFLEHEEDREYAEEYDIERDYERLNQKDASFLDRVKGLFSGKDKEEPLCEEGGGASLPVEAAAAEHASEYDAAVEQASEYDAPAEQGAEYEAVVLLPDEPPEDVPERRTSDEQIEAMLASLTGEVPGEDEYENWNGV